MDSPLRRRWLANANIPLRMQRRIFDLGVVPDEIAAYADAFFDGKVLGPEAAKSLGKGLALVGEPGHGKTTLACALLIEMIVDGPIGVFYNGKPPRPSRPVYFAYYPEILALVKRTFNSDVDPADEALHEALFGRGFDPVQVLVIDDLGKEHRTASHWAENFFDHLMRARFDRGLPTLITTNVEFPKWADYYGDSMASFAHEALRPVGIINKTGDRRL